MSIRSIVVAVDGSPLGLAAMEAGGEVAARLGASLTGLFVEDINILRLLDHPAVQTYSLSGARRQAQDDEVIIHAIRRRRAAARAAFESVQATHGLHGAFEVRQGKVVAEILAASRDSDLLCLGWCEKPPGGGKTRPGAVAGRLVIEAAPPVLLLRSPLAEPVVVVYDGQTDTRRALHLAGALTAGRDGGQVELILAAADAAEASRLEAEAAVDLAALGVRARVRATGRLSRALAGLPDGAMLVTTANGGLLLDELTCSVVVTR